jgi:hypothetical protein
LIANGDDLKTVLMLTSLLLALLSAVGITATLVQASQRRTAWQRLISRMWLPVLLRLSELAKRHGGKLARVASESERPADQEDPASIKANVTSLSSREPALSQAETMATALKLALDRNAEAAPEMASAASSG